VRILRRLARHRHCALDQCLECRRAQVGRGDTGGALPHKHAQADVLAFGTADVFEFAQPHLHAARALGGQHDVGGAGACAHGLPDQRVSDILGLFGGKHGSGD
jgi:hypothetical protein